MSFRFRVYGYLMAISAAFLGITFAVYIALPKLLNIHGKMLLCHVFSLFIAFSLLSVVQLTTGDKMRFCKLIGMCKILKISGE